MIRWFGSGEDFWDSGYMYMDSSMEDAGAGKNRSFTGSVLDLENFREVATNNTQINNQSTKKQLLLK